MRQFDALLKRHKYLQWREDLRASLMPWVYANRTRNEGDAFIPQSDFMEILDPSRMRERPQQTLEAMQQVLLRINAALGGEVVEL